MISKNEHKLIRALKTKKYRDKHNMFVAEGEKLVAHFIDAGWLVEKLFCTIQSNLIGHKNAREVSINDLRAVTHLDSPNTVLAIFKKQDVKPYLESNTVLILDDIRDPGNLGTIIRLADWFGVQQIICSNETVDLYNPKVVHSTMGSLANVSIIYKNVQSSMQEFKDQGYKVIGTLMHGENSKQFKWPDKCLLVLGNEAKGISKEVIQLIDTAITIPKANSASAESLNVAMAAAVLLGQIS